MKTLRGKVNMDVVINAFLAAAPAELAQSLSASDVSAVLTDYLHGERGLADAYALNIITSEEAALETTARLETWLVDRSAGTLEHGEWHPGELVAVLKNELEAARKLGDEVSPDR